MTETVPPVFKEIQMMFNQTTPPEEELAGWVRKSRSLDQIVKLPGDASTRKYYRVTSGHETWIVMKMEPFEEQGEKINFITMQRHLAAAGVPVPLIHEIDPKLGLILLEDLGDDTLLRKLQDVSSPDVERHIYQRVLNSLIRLQIEASPERRPADLEAFRLRFDHEKLLWELNNTVEHFYEKHLKRVIRDRDRTVMQEGFSEICTILANKPTVLCHRDFHSRNIMVTPDDDGNERLVMIDFQDARLGPVTYDLASLLRDSYYQLEEGQISRLLDYYIARWEALSGRAINRTEFQMEFDLMSVQRNFKAIGSFASFLNRRNDATYLKYIGNTFENIRRTLLKYPQYSKLREVLFHYYYF